MHLKFLIQWARVLACAILLALIKRLIVSGRARARARLILPSDIVHACAMHTLHGKDRQRPLTCNCMARAMHRSYHRLRLRSLYS